MTDPRIVYKNFIRNAELLTALSEDPQYPAESMQDDILDLPYRSRHGVGTGNGNFRVGSTTKYIDFDEGGAELTATLTVTTGYSGQTLAAEVKTQLDAAGALTYTVTYSETTGKFTIAASGNFTIRWETGTNVANSAGPMLGFAVTANDTGTDTYTSDTMVIHTLERIHFDLGAAYEYDSIAVLNHNLTSAATITVYGADDDAFTTNLVTDTLTYNANNIYAFLTTARTKRYVMLHIADVANPSAYVQVGAFVVGKYFQPNRNFGPYSDGPMDESETEKSPSGHLFVTVEKPKLDQQEYLFEGLNTTSADEVKLLLDECGVTKAVWLCTDTTAPNSNSSWVHLLETRLPYRQHNTYWIWEMPVEEVI